MITMPAAETSCRLSASYVAGPEACRFEGRVWGLGPLTESRGCLDAGGRLLVTDLGWQGRERQAQIETLRPLCEAFGKLAPRVVRAMATILEDGPTLNLRVALSAELMAELLSKPLVIEGLAITVSSANMDLVRSVFDSTGPYGRLRDGSDLISNDLTTRLEQERDQRYQDLRAFVLSEAVSAFEAMIAGSPGLPAPEVFEP
jgi:hypothetical protein